MRILLMSTLITDVPAITRQDTLISTQGTRIFISIKEQDVSATYTRLDDGTGWNQARTPNCL